jgi:hypothetical protein
LNDLKLLESLITRSDTIRHFENSASALLLLLIQKSADPNVFWAKIPRCHAVLLSTKHCLIKQAPKHVYLISKAESSKRNKINSEILSPASTFKYEISLPEF